VPNIIREIPYSESSWSVHSLAPSIRAIARARASEVFFNLQVMSDADSTLTSVLDGANIYGLVAVSMLDQYAAVGLESEVGAIQNDMRAQLSSVASGGPPSL